MSKQQLIQESDDASDEELDRLLSPLIRGRIKIEDVYTVIPDEDVDVAAVGADIDYALKEAFGDDAPDDQTSGGQSVAAPDDGKHKYASLSYDDQRKLMKRESYHRNKPLRVRADLSGMTPEERTAHKKETARLKKARQRAEAKARESGAPTGEPEIA